MSCWLRPGWQTSTWDFGKCIEPYPCLKYTRALPSQPTLSQHSEFPLYIFRHVLRDLRSGVGITNVDVKIHNHLCELSVFVYLNGCSFQRGNLTIQQFELSAQFLRGVLVSANLRDTFRPTYWGEVAVSADLRNTHTHTPTDKHKTNTHQMVKSLVRDSPTNKKAQTAQTDSKLLARKISWWQQFSAKPIQRTE